MTDSFSQPRAEQSADSPPPTAPARAIRYDQAWLVSFFRPALIVIMVICVQVALGALLRLLLPNAPSAFFPTLLLLSAIAAIIGVTTTTWLAQPDQRLRRTTAYRAAEIICLLALARLWLWLTVGGAPGFTDFILHPLSALVDGYFLTTMIIVTVAWMMAAHFSEDLLALAIQPDEVYVAEATTRDTRDASRGGGNGRQLYLSSFTGRWILGGVVLVVLASGTQLAPSGNGFFAILRQRIDPVVVGAIVAYFFAGLLLISQGQLALLRARWTIERIPSSEAVLRNWPGYVLIVLLGVGALAAIMPFGGTYYIALVISVVINAIYALVTLVINLFLLLLVLLLSLLPFSDASQESMQQIMAEPMARPTAPPPESLAWIGGSLFWVVAALMVGYASFIYFSGKGGGFGRLAWLWTMLKARWQQLFGGYREWRLARRVGQLRRAQPDDRSGGWRSWLDVFSRRKLTPEQRIRYYYLSMLEQAERVGAPRRRAETPNQYAPRLGATLATPLADDAPTANDEEADVEAAIDRLTDDFVLVRYAGQSVTGEEAGLLERLWNRLQSTLRRYADR